MLFDFVIVHREALIALTRAKVLKRLAPKPTADELRSGVPLFLDHLANALGSAPSTSNRTMNRDAAIHGAALLDRGYTVSQVVHDYGDVCQAVTELAIELDIPISNDEFHTLNRCLDQAIAEAVTEYTRLRERSMIAGETERSGVLAHELRNRVSAAQLAFLAIKSGRAPIAGSVAAVVTRNLHDITALIDRALVEVRLDSGITSQRRIRLHELIGDIEVDGTMEAGVHGVLFTVGPTDATIDVSADPQILTGAISNLLQNAFKFTRAGGQIVLRTSLTAAGVEIAIEDECGGLPAGKVAELFDAFQQRGGNRSGLGLGLFISRKGIEAVGGTLRVHDVPGHGCVFTIGLPVLPLAA